MKEKRKRKGEEGKKKMAEKNRKEGTSVQETVVGLMCAYNRVKAHSSDGTSIERRRSLGKKKKTENKKGKN